MEQAIKQDPNFLDAHLKLGQLYELPNAMNRP